jgi:hypothetical protein
MPELLSYFLQRDDIESQGAQSIVASLSAAIGAPEAEIMTDEPSSDGPEPKRGTMIHLIVMLVPKDSSL